MGLVGIIDPPKQGVADAIKQCHEAGIRVMMVTGDHPSTAVAIAKAVNIITHKNVIIAFVDQLGCSYEA